MIGSGPGSMASATTSPPHAAASVRPSQVRSALPSRSSTAATRAAPNSAVFQPIGCL